MRNSAWAFALAVSVSVLSFEAGAQTGTVTGRVIDQATGEAVAGARVSLAATGRMVQTATDGRFTIPRVDPGAHQVRVTFVGYAQRSQSITVAAGQTATADFALARSAVALAEVVVTATGREERRREAGNVVSTINVEEVELAAVPNMSALLQGRSAGVTVLPSGGTTGSGARIRIRGSNSVSLSNEPLLIVDGLRVNNSAASLTIATGGQSPSRLNDLNPSDIESIEILKGPAAAALYGTAAANGVIQVTTKRGIAGAARWSAYAEFAQVLERTDYRDNAIDEAWCTVFDQAAGDCTPGTLHRDNPFMDPELRPFVDGDRRKLGMNVSGGGEQLTYYLSGETDKEQGIFALNTTDRQNARANMNARINDKLNVSLRTGYVTSFVRMPQNDNNFSGIHLNGNLGYPRSHPDGSTGWYWQTPEQVFSVEADQDISRLTGGINVRYDPRAWLSLVATGGIDRVDRHDQEFVEPGINEVSQNLFAGTRRSHRAEILNRTGNFNATARFALRPTLTSTTSAGVQYHRDEFHDTRGFGVGVVPGTRSLSGTTGQYGVSEATTENATFGAYGSQQFALNDRLFLTGSLRGDKNSAFGTDIGWVNYPAVSASWVISEEGFFPRIPAVSALRIRSSFGQSGLRPSFRDAATFYAPAPVRAAATEQPGITLAGAGNPVLRPEISTEFEAGFDVGLLQDRLSVEFTHYRKKSKDALIRRRLAPSIGATTTRFENIGNVSNRGLEALLHARLFERPRFGLDATITYARTRNRLDKLGEGVEPIIFGLGSTQRHVEGYPLGGYWSKPMTWTDANGDDLVQFSEVTETADFEYMGTPFPTREASLSTRATLFNLIRVSALADYRGGHKLYNFTRGDRCAWEMVCEETYNVAAASVSDQLGWIGFNKMARNVSEFIEPADFVKLRELSVSFLVPSRMARLARTRETRVTLSGRNLGTWTKYSGYDPEVNTFGQDNFSTADYHNQPPTRHYTLRFDVNF